MTEPTCPEARVVRAVLGRAPFGTQSLVGVRGESFGEEEMLHVVVPVRDALHCSASLR
jgi:hypothetical protein